MAAIVIALALVATLSSPGAASGEVQANAETANGEVQYSSDDWLNLLAEEFQISPEETFRRFDWHSTFGDVVQSVRDDYKHFAYAEVTGERSADVAFVGSVPPDIALRFKELPVGVAFIQVAGLSEVEISPVVATGYFAARSVLLPEAGPGIESVSTSATYDRQSGRVTIYVGANEDAFRDDDPTTALRRAQEAVDEVASSRVMVDIMFEESTKSTLDMVRGGAALSTCTAGFTVNDYNSSGEGVLTADHCSNTQQYQGRNILTFKRSLNAAYGDIQYHESSDTVVNPSFFYNKSGDWKYVLGHRQPFLGEGLCKYGENTGKTCDVVYTFGECTGGYCNQTRMANRKADGGDSGGPWYTEHKAIGIHHGGMCTPLCRDTFTATHSNIGANLSVGIKEN